MTHLHMSFTVEPFSRSRGFKKSIIISHPAAHFPVRNKFSECASFKRVERAATRARLTTSLHISWNNPSSKCSEVSLVGAVRLNIHHFTTHRFARSYCKASQTLASRRDLPTIHNTDEHCPHKVAERWLLVGWRRDR